MWSALSVRKVKASSLNLVAILALVVPDLIILVLVIPQGSFRLNFIIFQIRLNFAICISSSYLSYYGTAVFGHPLLRVSSGFIVLGCIVRSFDIVIYSGEILGNIAVFCQGLGFFIFCILAIRWIRYIKPHFTSGLTIDQYCCNIYLACGTLLGFGLWIIEMLIASSNWYTKTGLDLMCQNYVFTLFLVTLTVCQGRAARREAAVFKVPNPIILS
eukprot:gene7244-14781_t